jgi:glycosyltransferase involved in cell wall biosynthesis
MTAPRITLAVFAYNQAHFIDEAVRSALAQACEPIEIILSDDASADGTFAQMQAQASVYRGPHQVIVRRNERNLGMAGHFNEVMRAARGELVVLMAGDDISLPERVAVMARTWDESQGRLDLMACDLIDMSADGVDLGHLVPDDLALWDSPQAWARRRPYIVGAGHALTRRQFTRFGPLGPGASLEDQINTFRAICGGGAATVREPLVRYRRGGVSTRAQVVSAESFVSLVRRQSARQIALFSQWLADARLAGCHDLVERVVRREFDRELFMRDLLAAPTLAARLRVTHEAGAVDLGWRARKLVYWQWPALAVGIRRMQRRAKILRHGEPA